MKTSFRKLAAALSMIRLLLLAVALAGATSVAAADPPCIVSGPFIRYYSSGNGVWKGSVLVVTPPLPSLSMNVMQGAGNTVTLGATRLYALALSPTRKINVWRIQLTLQQEVATVPVQYWFPTLSKCGRFPTLGKTFVFNLPGASEPFHWSFYSCHDEGAYFQPDYFKQYPRGAKPTWQHLLGRHAASPLHLLVGLGDQIYNDGVLQVPSLAKVWKSAKNPKDRLALWRSIKWTPAVQKQVTDFYVLNYLRKFAHPIMSIAFASIPTSHMWDDHEVFDGLNDQDPAVTALPIYNQIVRAGMIFFRLFQLHATPQLPSGEVFFKPGFSTIKSLGPGAAMLMLDTRTERTRKQFVSAASYGVTMSQLARLPDSVDFLFVMTGDPVVAPNSQDFTNPILFPTIAPLYSLISEWGDSALLDDSSDLWSWPTRRDERAALVKRMQSLAKSKSVRVVFVGGDVHSTGMGALRSTNPFLKDSKDHRYMPGFTSSAIGVAPIPDQLCKLYNLMALFPAFLLDGTTTLKISPAFKDTSIQGRCGDGQYWIAHRNYGEVLPVASGQVQVNVWYEADNKDSDLPFRSFGATVPHLRV